MQRGISAQALRYTAGGHELIKNISLAVAPGQLCAIVGPSGAGKSTLLKLLCGIKPPAGGAAYLDGAPAADCGRAPHRVGYVPQDDIIHRALTVERVLGYAAALRLGALPDPTRAAQVEAVLALLGLDQRRAVKVRRLSGGQRKRVSIGVELLARPSFLFLDEPTSGLDPGLERQLMGTLRELATGGRTVVLTTHVMESMSAVDLLAVVYDGHLAFFGPPTRALPFFRVEVLRELFDQLPKRAPASWSRAYERERAVLCQPVDASADAPSPPREKEAAP